MKKETVTLDNIKADILNYCTYDLKRLVFPFVFTLIWASVLILLILAIPMPRPLIFIKIIVIFLALLTLLITTIYLLEKMKNIIKIKKIAQNGQFKITLDTLEGTYNNYKRTTTEFWFMLRGITKKLHKPNYLKFFQNGDFAVPMCEIYTWSDECKVSGTSVFSYAQKGDEFYIVKSNNEIVMIYKTKLFKIDI